MAQSHEVQQEIVNTRQRKHTVGRRTTLLKAESLEDSGSDTQNEYDLVDEDIQGAAGDHLKAFSRERSESTYHQTREMMTTN